MKRPNGFTLVEILFALALIALLVGMLFLGMGHLVGGAKEKQTKVTLAALQGMLGELDAKTHLNKSPREWLWHNPVALATVMLTPAGGFDFWRDPSPHLGTPPYPQPLDAPGLVTRGSSGDPDPTTWSQDERSRNGSRQVLNTQLAMIMILGMPDNRKALENTAADRYFIPRWIKGGLPAPGADGVLYTTDDQYGKLTEDFIYPFPLGAQVLDAGGSRYVCIPPSVPNSPPPGPQWKPDTGPAYPLLLDAWDNPIIFVPATGLRVRLLNGAPDYLDKSIPPKVKTAIIISPEGKVGDSAGAPVVLQPGRPFFASAGQDGDFAKGDDNIYSFEQ